uniref:Rad21/Rec8-like protein C-terminal eukaryotic domain-containing protein n=1 Tax=Kalanchoe fedtschenkoi TaxID=63787 RepID=A0A7N0TQE1_KALFE
MRGNLDSDVVGFENVMGLNTSGIEPEKRAQTKGLVAPGDSGDDVRSIPSTGSGNSWHSFTSHASSGRLNRKRPYSMSGQDGVGLEPVTEENPLNLQELNFKLAQLHESGTSPENDPLVETEPTQTQKTIKDHPVGKITDGIRMHWKTHFDTPGVPPTESLNNLTSGTSRKKAAQLFYQTCVLASLDFLRVEQKVPYEDILISRGAKM